MKKSLIAMAALAATASFAQSSVTLYGQFDAGVYSIKNFQDGKSATVYGDGATFSNVWGMRGSEDLGGGLKANFNLESDIQTNNGGLNQNGLFRRQANVSVGGNFGEVKFGITTNPLIATNGLLAPVGGNSVMTATAAALGYADFYTRNAVTYTSPSLSGLVAQVQYGFANDADGQSSNGSVTAGSLAYTNGPLQVRAAMQQRKGAVANPSGAAQSGSAATATSAWPNDVGNTSGLNKDSYVLGARYSLGALELGAAYMSNEMSIPQIDGKAKVTGYLLGAGYTVNAWTLGVNYVNSEKSTLTSLQARYALSKRTNLIATAGFASNDATVAFAPLAFNTGNSPATITNSTLGTLGNRGTDRSITGFGVGLTHSF